MADPWTSDPIVKPATPPPDASAPWKADPLAKGATGPKSKNLLQQEGIPPPGQIGQELRSQAQDIRADIETAFPGWDWYKGVNFGTLTNFRGADNEK